MPYRIESHIDQQNHLRCHQPERHYIDELTRRGGALTLDNVIVDVEQIILRSFQCDTRECLRTTGVGADKRFKGSCCTDLQIDLTDVEVARMRQLGRLASQTLKLAASDPLSAIVRRLGAGDFTEKNERGERMIKHLPSGRCPAGWIDKDAALRCGLNTLCERLALPLTHYKSGPCFLFPLHTVEHAPGAYFLTLLCKATYEWVGSHVIVARLRCLCKPPPGAPPAYMALKDEIILCFGENFYHDLACEAKAILKTRAEQQALEPAAR